MKMCKSTGCFELAPVDKRYSYCLDCAKERLEKRKAAEKRTAHGEHLVEPWWGNDTQFPANAFKLADELMRG